MRKIEISACFKKVCIAVTAFMILAHMYAFTNGVYLYDAVDIYRGGPSFSVSDRYARDLYWWIDLGMSLPWFAGIWATVLMILSVYFICEILEIQTTWGIVLTSGLCAVDTAIIAEQQYTGQNYYIIIPLLEAVLAAWVIRKSGLKPVIKAVMAMILIALSGGTYAAMVSVAPTLLLVSVIFDILKGGSGKENWTRALKYVGFFLSGMALYYIVLRVLLVVRGGHLQSYMNENVLESVSGIISMARRIGDAYVNIAVFYAGHNPYLLPSILNKVLPIIVILGVVESLILLITVRDQIRDKLMNGILLVIALMISPAVVNLIYIATLGASFAYPLLLFTYCIPLIAFVRVNELLMNKLSQAKIRYIGYISRAAYIFFIYYSIVMSNSLYISAQQAYIETISIGTRLLDRIETCDGFTGTEEVVLVGCSDKNPYWGHPRDDGAMILNVFCGLNSLNSNGITPTRAVPFLKNTLDSTLTYTVCNTMDDFLRIEDLTDDEKERIMDMPSFPVKGSVEKIGEKIYVKFYELQSTTD